MPYTTRHYYIHVKNGLVDFENESALKVFAPGIGKGRGGVKFFPFNVDPLTEGDWSAEKHELSPVYTIWQCWKTHHVIHEHFTLDPCSSWR